MPNTVLAIGISQFLLKASSPSISPSFVMPSKGRAAGIVILADGAPNINYELNVEGSIAGNEWITVKKIDETNFTGKIGFASFDIVLPMMRVNLANGGGVTSIVDVFVR